MKKSALVRGCLPFLLILIHSNSVLLNVQTANQSPVFVYVKTATAKVSIKPAGQSDWNEIQKFGRLFSGDSLKIPKKATVLLGDGSSAWKELTGPKAMVIPNEQNKRNKFGRYIAALYANFFVAPYARTDSKAGVRNSEALLLALPDTTVAYTMPENIRWIKSAPWWTAYQVQIFRDQETVLDTVVTGSAFGLDKTVRLWQRPGNYHVKVILPQGVLLETEVDSCVILLLPESQSAIMKNKLEALTKHVEQKGRREDYLALVDFCLQEKLYLDLGNGLIRMIEKFPNEHEPQAMWYAYYASFMPEETAERLVMERIKELQ